MHHALTIPELVGIILVHLDLRDQARMARVCRCFFSTAIAYVWMAPQDGQGRGFMILTRLWMHTGALVEETVKAEEGANYTRYLRFDHSAPFHIPLYQAELTPSFSDTRGRYQTTTGPASTCTHLM